MKLHFSIYDLLLAFECDDRSLIPHLLTCLPPGCQAATGAGGGRVYQVRPGNVAGFELWGDSSRLAQTASLQDLLDVLEGEIQLYVAEFAKPWVFVHAGAVVWQGRAIVLPGRSFAGKSTLVAALLRAGAEYLSDEYAVVDRCGMVHPYPRRLSLRNGPRASIRCTPQDFGTVVRQEPTPVGFVGFFSYRHPPRVQLRPLSPAKALMNMLLNAVPVRQRPQDVLETLTQIVGRVPVLTGDRGEADPFAERLLRASDFFHQETSTPPRIGVPDHVVSTRT